MTRRAQIALVAALLTLASFSVGLRQIADWDFWWQIRIAHDAWVQRSVLPVDTMSFSVPGAAWPHKDLVGYLPLWWAWEVGPLALHALLGATVLVGAAALWFVPPRAHRDPLAWLVTGNVWIAAVEARVMPRALVFSITLFVVMAVLLDHARCRAAEPRRLLPMMLAAAVLEGVWMNLHRGGIHGLVLLVGFTGWTLLGLVAGRVERLRPLVGPRVHPLSPLVAAGGVALAVALGALNPSGLAVYTTGFRVSYDAIHRTRITEWAALTPEIALSTYPVATAMVAVVAIATLVGLARAWSRRARPVADVWHLGVMGVFAWQGRASARWMTDAASAAALPLARLLAAAVTHARERGLLRDSPALIVALGLALPLGADALNHQRFGVGLEADRYPTAAMQFAREQGLGPDVHNAFVYGGYVLWEGRDPQAPFRALIDGRNDMVYPSAFYARCVDGQTDPAIFAELQRENPSDWVLADNTPGRESFTFLANDPQWAMVFWSEPATVWVRRDLHAGVARELRYRALRPGAEAQGLLAALQSSGGTAEGLAAIDAELDRVELSAPDSFRTLTLRALFEHVAATRDPEAAAQRDLAVARMLLLHPDHPGLEAVLAALNQPAPALWPAAVPPEPAPADPALPPQTP